MTPPSSYLYAYCERSGTAGFWSEPFNLLTNIAFILAALALFLLWKRTPLTLRAHGDVALLMALLAAIGLGSGAWHAIPTGTTLLLDVVPIGLFIHVYLLSFLRRIACASWSRTVTYWLVFVAASVAAELYLPPDLWNGSVLYLPAFCALLLMTIYTTAQNLPCRRYFIPGFAVWVASLTARSFDQALCGAFPLGTHFLWHLLNSLLLYLLMRALISTVRPIDASLDS